MTLYNATISDNEARELMTLRFDQEHKNFEYDSTRESQLWVIRAIVLSSFSTLAVFAGVLLAVIR